MGHLKRAAVLAVCLIASLTFSTQAGAEASKDTKIVIAGDPAFHGTVESTSKHCVEGRTVKVLRKVRNGRDKLLGTTVTDADGNWTLLHKTRAGVYYAKVVRTDATSGQFCAGDRSNKLSFG